MGRPKNTIPRMKKKFVSISSDGCWNWTGKIAPNGYGHSTINFKTVLAHRAFYEHYRGAIPEGLTVDHLCRNRACVNPDHLDIVTQKVNNHRSGSPSSVNARKTHCIYGHPLSGDNLYLRPGRPGHRQCKKCAREAMKRHTAIKDSQHAARA